MVTGGHLGFPKETELRGSWLRLLCRGKGSSEPRSGSSRQGGSAQRESVRSQSEKAFEKENKIMRTPQPSAMNEANSKSETSYFLISFLSHETYL